MRPDFTNVSETRQSLLDLFREIEASIGVNLSIATALEEAGDDALGHLEFLAIASDPRSDWEETSRCVFKPVESLAFWRDTLGTHNPHRKTLLPILRTLRHGWPVEDDPEPEMAFQDREETWEKLTALLQQRPWASRYDKLDTLAL